MAYVSQELKAQLAPAIKDVCKKYGIKASLAVDHHSTLVLNISKGKINFFTSYNKIMKELTEYKYPNSSYSPENNNIQVNTNPKSYL